MRNDVGERDDMCKHVLGINNPYAVDSEHAYFRNDGTERIIHCASNWCSQFSTSVDEVVVNV